MPLIDFHTHSDAPTPDTINIRAFSPKEFEQSQFTGECTVGLHPWQTDDSDVEEQLELLSIQMAKPSVIALGEVGLDRLRGATLEIQKEILSQQLAMAKGSGKPVVIHCVRAWDAILAAKDKFSPSLPWAVHGFRGVNLSLLSS